jgi:hypothetical protein
MEREQAEMLQKVGTVSQFSYFWSTLASPRRPTVLARGSIALLAILEPPAAHLEHSRREKQ